jgi:hypothetical protein
VRSLSALNSTFSNDRMAFIGVNVNVSVGASVSPTFAGDRVVVVIVAIVAPPSSSSRISLALRRRPLAVVDILRVSRACVDVCGARVRMRMRRFVSFVPL